MSRYVIGVDLGGTRIRAARLDKQLNIIERVEALTLADEGLEATLARIKTQIQKVLPEDKSEIMGIGLSAPGPLNPITGVIVAPPNLPGWKDVPLGDILKAAFDVPVFVGNDANVAILAEATRGAAKGYRNAIYITISTGIGSGIVADGRLLLGSTGLAAEFGHIIMLVEDRVSTLELEAAGPDMAMQAVKRIEAGERSAIVDMVRRGNLELVTGEIVGRAATKGDPLALSIVQRSGHLVGCGIVTLLHLFNPEIIVIGGGVSQLGDLLFQPMHNAIRKYSIDDDYWRDLVITSPDLGGDVSIYGAAALVVTNGGVEDVTQVAAMIG